MAKEFVAMTIMMMVVAVSLEALDPKRALLEVKEREKVKMVAKKVVLVVGKVSLALVRERAIFPTPNLTFMKFTYTKPKDFV